VVEDPGQRQFYGLAYDPTVGGSRRAHLGALLAEIPAKLERRIVARRAAMELRAGASLNFGFGMPGGIFGVIAEQGNAAELWMSLEQGTHNGRMLDDSLFGAARNTDATITAAVASTSPSSAWARPILPATSTCPTWAAT
jgi:acyl CoA:acetate/3-ketoacid CoA transferase